jgi:hypothetical protein
MGNTRVDDFNDYSEPEMKQDEWKYRTAGKIHTPLPPPTLRDSRDIERESVLPKISTATGGGDFPA